ncbi:uncharacterized protein LOC126838606 [Adelges cooleyi]|uniref:uncharacterized protein LOC126838606 n=1 Tax=Adelges cooleyi TaxID=133065 RepID=UPI0021804C81|nr:uncharacterized protein LOC126838606 [Adelges cooleyi]XP_050429107.1 uncharacterized protein LOC126838606 [Adelges cooleyi]
MFSTKSIYILGILQSKLSCRLYRKNVKTNLMPKRPNKIKGNPGGNRLLAMALDGDSPDKVDISLDEIDDAENDMLQSHLFYDQHMKEKEKGKQIKSFQNIKRMYFKNRIVLPNFLTYLEKQQIRNLHKNSPKEWTVETLSLCFPATPDIIKKILKSQWQADEGQQILRHDKLVQQNWESFRNGSINTILPDNLKSHLSKFSERRPNLITLNEAEKFIPKPAVEYLSPKEFGKIITSYIGEPVKNDEQKQLQQNEESNFLRIYESDLKTDSKKKHFILDELNHDLMQTYPGYKPTNSLSLNEKSVDASTVEISLQESTRVISRKEVSNFIDTINDYPLAIRIPKQLWKEGYTYRVNDCFYGDNGEFLYRVPGLVIDN